MVISKLPVPSLSVWQKKKQRKKLKSKRLRRKLGKRPRKRQQLLQQDPHIALILVRLLQAPL
jgi:hypothetical protein